MKEQLEAAKIERQHKEECEAIRKLIAAQSPRRVTQKQLDDLEKELIQLEAENNAAARTIELRKKQFGLLLHVVSVLFRVLRKLLNLFKLEQLSVSSWRLSCRRGPHGILILGCCRWMTCRPL